ncbi:exported hypothetical protein [Planktothrix serta PCC 8927]|uniref:Uncharacterized protein n=1 Tax=Planktothrix serta PCC 8927 TaxID=671068 RepID=A0A7Z9BMX9_9CYAN|nr:hypothetical protein [Planktothrix serta]VXD17901.1 exported hypothetical protein [Planktothrix serta PCC 8927]
MKIIGFSLIIGVGIVAIASFSAQAEQRITYKCTKNMIRKKIAINSIAFQNIAKKDSLNYAF